jgi:hypothetical protein
MMQVLTDFVEREKPFEHFDTSYHYDSWLRIRDLYEWWHIRRPAKVQAVSDALTAWHDEFQRLGGLTSKPTENATTRLMVFPQDRGADVRRERELNNEMRRLEAELEAEDEAMMIRLVRLRGHLWT